MKNANSTGTSDCLAVDQLDVSNIAGEENEELIKLMTELETTKKAYISEQQRVSELEEQLMTISKYEGLLDFSQFSENRL